MGYKSAKSSHPTNNIKLTNFQILFGTSFSSRLLLPMSKVEKNLHRTTFVIEREERKRVLQFAMQVSKFRKFCRVDFNKTDIE